MCGIAGFNFDDKELIKRMCTLLSHRGPDSHAYFLDDKISLGHRRLKVIDLSERAAQPMSNEDKSIWLVYNGEVYNFRKLRNELEKRGHLFKSDSDSEVIIHGYEEWGNEIVKRLRGMFAFAIYSANEQKILLARDRIGIKPLHYYFDGEKFIFASEIKAILEEIKPKLNKKAVDEFFTFQYTIAPRTLFEGIKKIKAGELIEFDIKSREITSEVYWRLSTGILEKSEDFFIKKIEEKIKEAVELRLISDVPLGIYLSGGLDSSYIASVARELKDDIRAYTIAFNHESDEVEYAKKVAEHLDLEHREIFVEADEIKLLPKVTWHFDMPVVNIASVPLYIISKVSKKYLTVALMGDGGDELFGGYEKYKLLALREKIKAMPEFLLKALAKITPLKKENKERLREFIEKNDAKAYLSYISSFSKKEKKELYNGIEINNQEEKLSSYFASANNSLQAAMLFDLKTLLPDDYLMKVDKATMANAVEARVPYLDSELVELCFSMPQEYRVSGIKTKVLFRKVLSKKLPKEIVKRKKHGFNVPTLAWLDKGLYSIAEQLFELTPKIINKEYAKKILRNFKNNPRYYSRQFWSIFSFNLWYRMYFESERKSFDLDYYL